MEPYGRATRRTPSRHLPDDSDPSHVDAVSQMDASILAPILERPGDSDLPELWIRLAGASQSALPGVWILGTVGLLLGILGTVTNGTAEREKGIAPRSLRKGEAEE